MVTENITYGDSLEIEIQIEAENDIDAVLISFVAYDHSEKAVMCWHSSQNKEPIKIRRGAQSIRIRITPLLLASGSYSYTVNMSSYGSIEHLIWYHHIGTVTVTSPHRPIGDVPYLPHTNDFHVIHEFD
jgi:hypothetical protein